MAKLQDIVGLYVDPPAHAIVLSVDEKSQIQALGSNQPGLPIEPGRCRPMTHDYKCNGTTTLFAALDVLEGEVIGQRMQLSHQGFIRFLDAIEAKVPAGNMVHVILDNDATHKHQKVMAWLTRHPRFIFLSIVDLQVAIKRFLEKHNGDLEPFVWTADPDHIIATVKQGHQALEMILECSEGTRPR